MTSNIGHRYLKPLILLVLMLGCTVAAHAQACGPLVPNPSTGQLDCIGSASRGQSGGGTLCWQTDDSGVLTFGSCAGSASTNWGALSNPSGNLALSMAANTTVFTTGTGTSTSNLWTWQDTTGNTGTGSLVLISTIGTSTLKPFTVTAQGTSNGIQMSNLAVLSAIGTGVINANQVFGATVPTSATVLGSNGSKQVVAASTTGSGNVVLATNPTIDLASATGLPISTGVTGLGTGVATLLGTFSSANLLAALTTKTGTGTAVFSISPTFTGTVTAAAVTLSGALTTNVTGSTQCLHVDTAGLITGTGSDCGSSSGTGTVSVVGAGSLTSTAIATGGGTTLIQTPNGSATLDSGGNMSLPGTSSTGVGSGNAGAISMTAGAALTVGANVFGFSAPTTMTTSVVLRSPNAVPGANNVMLIGAPSSNIADFTYVAFASTSLTDTGQIVRKNQSNTYSAGTQNFADVSMVIPSPNAGSTSEGQIAIDSNFNLRIGDATVNNIVGMIASAPTNGNCAGWSVSASAVRLTDAGACSGTPIRTLGGTFTNGTSTLATGVYCCIVAPTGGTLKGWSITVDDNSGSGTCGSCTATVKFWRAAAGTSTPTSSGSINTSGVALSTGTAVEGSCPTNCTDFTMGGNTITAGDIFAVQLSAVANAKSLTAGITYQ